MILLLLAKRKPEITPSSSSTLLRTTLEYGLQRIVSYAQSEPLHKRIETQVSKKLFHYLPHQLITLGKERTLRELRIEFNRGAIEMRSKGIC